jgi:hypothetical protein
MGTPRRDRITTDDPGWMYVKWLTIRNCLWGMVVLCGFAFVISPIVDSNMSLLHSQKIAELESHGTASEVAEAKAAAIREQQNRYDGLNTAVIVLAVALSGLACSSRRGDDPA